MISHGLAVQLMERTARARTSLESERFGLLAARQSLVDKDRRMEEWIASNLDLDDDARPAAAQPLDSPDRRPAGLEARSQGKASPKRGRDIACWAGRGFMWPTSAASPWSG